MENRSTRNVAGPSNSKDNVEKFSKIDDFIKIPEDFVVDGSAADPRPRKLRQNKKIINHTLRVSGKGYIRFNSMNLVPPRTLGKRCTSNFCVKSGKKCNLFTENERINIFNAFYELGNIQLQREYIVRHTTSSGTAQKTAGEQSRRQRTVKYYFPHGGSVVRVCKAFFISTLAISDKIVRTSLEKLSKSTGVIEKDKRGGRTKSNKDRDQIVRKSILDHIQRFPKMESHYCRANTTREYLNSDLTIGKMYAMYTSECQGPCASIQMYRRMFKTLNLSIHNPIKDQCTMCNMKKEGNIPKKLKKKYTFHILQKTTVRALKTAYKTESILLPSTVLCAVFDLQQVIYIPRCNDSNLFYKRRLANFNFTVYDVGSRDCQCFFWHEGIGRRGSSEISSSLFLYLMDADRKGIKNVALFADGCSGQNKNSIVASMLLRSITMSRNIEEISLRFFEHHHGQNEGDSAHSTITCALSRAPNIYVPSQLPTLFALSRYKNPYKVHELQHNDFTDFKTFSRTLRMLNARKDDQGGDVDWTKMREFMVLRKDVGKVYFKRSHVDVKYSSITILKRQDENSKKCILNGPIPQLYRTRPKISNAKFADLMSLCKGDTPVIRNPDHINFYKSLPHL